MKRLSLLTIICLFVFGLSSLAVIPEHLLIQGPPPVTLPFAARQLVDFETQHNPMGARSHRPFWIEHLEIPVSALNSDISKFADPRIYESITFERQGKTYVRWILNPEDTRYSEELIAKLKKRKIIVKRKRHFIGYLTASRSCIVQDPESGIVFSAKASTNVTGGVWIDKKLKVNEGEIDRTVSDIVLNNDLAPHLRTSLETLPDTFAFFESSSDQAFTIRQYDQFNDPNYTNILAPLFSVVTDEILEHIKMGIPVQNINDFIANNLFGPLGTAMAEYNLLFGLNPDSRHGQNFLIELDRNFKPTGRIFFRDLGDVEVASSILPAMIGGTQMLELHRANSPNYVKEGIFREFSISPVFGVRGSKVITLEFYDKSRDYLSQMGPAYLARLNGLTHEVLGTAIDTFLDPTLFQGRISNENVHFEFFPNVATLEKWVEFLRNRRLPSAPAESTPCADDYL